MELIDILDEQGNKTGVIKSKKEVHREGLWHQTAHIWFVNSKGEILLQRRSKLMDNNPDMFDISVAGHISAGEEIIPATLREVKEEIGFDLDPAELIFFGKTRIQTSRNEGAYLNNEFNYLYLVRKDLNIAELQLQVEEVSALKWLPLSEFKKWIAEKRADLVMHPEEYELLFKAINN